jgi:hypothetical protein
MSFKLLSSQKVKLCVALAALHVIAKLLFIFIVVPSRAMSCHLVPCRAMSCLSQNGKWVWISL